MSDRQKITETHLHRRAVVYVRQSTVTQLERNHESRARQYGLRERAVELGWPAGSVTVVDEDLGRSGASTEGRGGFKDLVAQRAFFRQLALDAGRTLAWERLDARALVRASQCSVQGDNRPLRELIGEVLDLPNRR